MSFSGTLFYSEFDRESITLCITARVRIIMILKDATSV